MSLRTRSPVRVVIGIRREQSEQLDRGRQQAQVDQRAHAEDRTAGQDLHRDRHGAARSGSAESFRAYIHDLTNASPRVNPVVGLR